MKDKNIDKKNKDIYILRKKTTRLENNESVIIATLEKIDNNLTSVYEHQSKLSDAFIASNNDLHKKLYEVEKSTHTLRLVTSHWKIIAWIIAAAAAVGFSFENGVKDVFYHFTNAAIFKPHDSNKGKDNG